MQNFILALEKSIETKNWYSVLFILLALPDICGKVDYPTLQSKERTVRWFDEYLKKYFTRKIGPQAEEHVFLTGRDFYALRCAYLHEGIGDISTQRAQEILNRFEFIQPVGSYAQMHMNKFDTTLQLQVDCFGEDLLKALKQWLDDIKEDELKLSKIQNMLKIHMMLPGVGVDIKII